MQHGMASPAGHASAREWPGPRWAVERAWGGGPPVHGGPGGAGVAWAGSMVDRPRGGTGLRSTLDRGRDRAGARGGGAGRGGAMAGLAASLLRSAMEHGKQWRGHGRVARAEASAVRAVAARK